MAETPAKSHTLDTQHTQTHSCSADGSFLQIQQNGGYVVAESSYPEQKKSGDPIGIQ